MITPSASTGDEALRQHHDVVTLQPPRCAGLGQVAPAVFEPLRAGRTGGFPELLRMLGVSLLVTTYQAGKLVVVREQAGRLNTLSELSDADGPGR